MLGQTQGMTCYSQELHDQLEECVAVVEAGGEPPQGSICQRYLDDDAFAEQIENLPMCNGEQQPGEPAPMSLNQIAKYSAVALGLIVVGAGGGALASRKPVKGAAIGGAIGLIAGGGVLLFGMQQIAKAAEGVCQLSAYPEAVKELQSGMNLLLSESGQQQIAVTGKMDEPTCAHLLTVEDPGMFVQDAIGDMLPEGCSRWTFTCGGKTY